MPEVVRIPISFTPEERAEYNSFSAPLKALAPGGWKDVARVAELARTSPGRTAIRMDGDARAIAGLCAGKREALAMLLERHRGERVWIVAARDRDAFSISCQYLVPMLTGAVSAREREIILHRYRIGRVSTVVSDSARDAEIAQVGIVLDGESGRRPWEPSWSLLYELAVDLEESDERAVA